MDIAADDKYPTIMPTISSATLFRIFLDNKSSMIMTVADPHNAPDITAIKPFRVRMSVDSLPLKSSITMATPKLAPLLIPKIEGPASGLLNDVCNINPDTANDAPHNKAVMAAGIRDCSMMYCHVAFSSVLPHRMCHIAFRGMFTEPMVIFSINSNIKTAVAYAKYLLVLLCVVINLTFDR